MTEMAVTTGAIRRAKLQSNHHHQHPVLDYKNEWKKRSERCKHCALAVVRWSQKFPGRRTAKI